MDKPQNLQGFFFVPPVEQNFIAHILEEIYKTGLYYPFIPKTKEGSVVIDAGANIGLTSYFFSQHFDKVYAIEPAQEHLDVLNYMLEYNGIKNVIPCKFALSMIDSPKEKFYHYSNRTMNSLYGNLAINNNTGLQQTGSEEVELKRLDTFMKENKIEHVDLLKMDVEGVEFEIFGSDSFANVADKIDTIVGEMHNYSGRNPNQIIDALKMNGFEFQAVQHDAHLFIATKKK